MRRMTTSAERSFATVGVIGLGTMGAGIAEVFARNGYAVVGIEKDADALDRGRQYLEHSPTRAVKKEKLTEAEQAELLGRITFSTSMGDLADADLVVEADVQSLMAALGKTPVVCGDKAGFIANTLLFGYLNHAVSMYEGRYATREDIDAAMRFGCGYPMGPLALLDLIGLDTAYEILETMYRQGRDRLHAPSPILKQMVTAGWLGRKTGRGFYTYEAPDSPVVVPDDRTPSATPRRGCATRSPRSASSAPARWRPASSRSSPRPGTTSSSSAAARRSSTAWSPRSPGASTSRSSAAGRPRRPR